MISPAARLAALPEAKKAEVLSGLRADQLAGLQYVWPFWARSDQRRPEVPFRTWLLLGGRGSGKTRSASEDIRAEVAAGRRRSIGIVGPSADAVRRIQIEGPSGILAVSPPHERPVYEMSIGRLTWPNGAQGFVFTSEEVERLRGPNLDLCWLDEMAAYPNAQQVWDMAQFATRLPGPKGDPACFVVTTTPRPIPLLRFLRDSPDTVVTRSRTDDNRGFLDDATLRYLHRRYDLTSIGRQELFAELLDESEGSLWTRAMIDDSRVDAMLGRRVRVVVAVDPSGGAGAGNAECGIVVCAKDERGHGYVLQDASARLSPERWARRCVDLYEQWSADRIICEQNYGGAMVESTVRMVSQNAAVKMIVASRGKQQRCEPIAALYEQSKIHHVGMFGELEDQMTQWVPGIPGQPSPDRVDALTWGLSELLVNDTGLNIEVWLRCANLWKD